MSSYRPQRPPGRPPPGPPPRQGDDREYSRNDGRYSRFQPHPSTYGDYRNSRDSHHPPAPGYDSFRPPQSDFTFRVEKPAGVQETRFDGDGGGDSRRGKRSQYNGRRNGREGGGGGGRPQQRSHQFAPWRKLAADRPILNATHDASKELSFMGSASGVTYRALDELSDSDEAEMDISDNDAEESGERASGPSSKKRRLSAGDASGNSVPKWSNPDPYTAAPPPDISQHKKKDVVQLIRKARVQPAPGSKPAVAMEEADFISCDLDDSDGNDYLAVVPPQPPRRRDVPDASIHADILAPRSDLRSQAPVSNLPSKAPQGHLSAPADSGLANPPTQLHTSHSDDLGSRKRTYDDEIKMPDHAKLKKHTTKMAAGSVVRDWLPVKGQNPCPWVATDHSHHHSVGVWLHKEIVDFYEYVKPRDFEERLRQSLVDELSKLVRQSFGNLQVYPFGSFKSGLYLPTGDMDLVICSDSYMRGGPAQYQPKRQVYNFARFVERKKLAHDNHVDRIARARVPLVKYVDVKTGLKVDISFENATGPAAIKTFLAWRDQFPAMPILVTIIKHFLAMRGLNEPANGGIGGFSVICLVVSLLQLMPEVQSRALVPERHLGQLLLAFFDLYGNKFQYQKMAIRLNPPSYVRKNDVTTFAYKNTDRLSIIDPNDPQNDISGGSSNIATIQATFSKAHELLRERIAFLARSPTNPQFASVLESIFAGNYTSFEAQRNHLRTLWDRSQSSARR